MNNQTNKRSSKITLIVTAINAFMALILTLTWFMPVLTVHGDSYSMPGTIDKLSGSDAEAAAIGFWFIVILCTASIAWALIPKRWAAIVGMIYAILPTILCIAQVSDWKSHGLELAFGSIIMVPLAILVFILSIIKLVVLIKAAKQNHMNDIANQTFVTSI